MADLDFVSTEELIFELRNRADQLILWYAKNGDDDVWGTLKGSPYLIGGVAECVAETADELALLTREELDDTDATAIFKEKLLNKFK